MGGLYDTTTPQAPRVRRFGSFFKPVYAGFSRIRSAQYQRKPHKNMHLPPKCMNQNNVKSLSLSLEQLVLNLQRRVLNVGNELILLYRCLISMARPTQECATYAKGETTLLALRVWISKLLKPKLATENGIDCTRMAPHSEEQASNPDRCCFCPRVPKHSCRNPGSNWGPSDLRSDALPTELSRRLNIDTLARFYWTQPHNAEKTVGPARI